MNNHLMMMTVVLNVAVSVSSAADLTASRLAPLNLRGYGKVSGEQIRTTTWSACKVWWSRLLSNGTKPDRSMCPASPIQIVCASARYLSGATLCRCRNALVK